MASADSLYKQITQMNNNLQIQLGKMAQQNTKTEQTFNSAEAQKTRTYNAEEAVKARDWEKMMSDTSHQREVADLLAAGLNPVLSANNGANSYTTSAASAQNASAGVDSAVNAIASNSGAGMSAMASLYGSEWSANATRAAAATSAAATRYAAARSAAAQEYAASMAYKAQKYAVDNSRNGTFAGVASKYIDKAVGKSFAQSTTPYAIKSGLRGMQSSLLNIPKKVASNFFKSTPYKSFNSNQSWQNLSSAGKGYVKYVLTKNGFNVTNNACKAVAYAITTGKPVNWSKWLTKSWR